MRKISVLAIFLSVGIGSAATAAQNTDVPHTDDMVEINGQLYPIVGMGCSVNGIPGSLSSINGLTVAVKQWYEQRGRIIVCGDGGGAGTHSCYCHLAADCFVGDTCGSLHAGEDEYCSSYTTPRAFKGRIVSPNTQNVGVPCNEIGMTCKCDVEKCEGYMDPNLDGTCPELPDETETQPEQESSDSETENPGGCPVGQWPDEHGVCRPMGGFVDAGHGGYGYAGRNCSGALHSYDPNATVGYWTQSIYGRHTCVGLGGNENNGPYVRCSCGSTECKRGYREYLGHCYTNAEYARITERNGTGTGGANSRTGNTTTGQNSTGTGGTNAGPAPLPNSTADDCPGGTKNISGHGSLTCGTDGNGNVAVLNQPCIQQYIDEWRRTTAPKASAGKWVINNIRGQAMYACKNNSGDGFVPCNCGITECEPGWKPDNGWRCVSWPNDPRLLETPDPEQESVDTQDVTEESEVCVNGNQTVGGESLPCAKDASGNFSVVVNVSMPCHSDVIAQVTNASAGEWKSDANGGYACKTSADSNAFERCKCHITDCNGDYEPATDGLSCQQTAAAPRPENEQSAVSISELAGRLAKVENQFGLSKWRTADGEFNKARLASDLTAGVVLGTTGALVTSSVVKKKQVKEGFEALECTVGGQRVGDYGDKFHISGK